MIVNSEPVSVSILVPVYNVSRYIEQCAVSLFEQTYDNIEYVFVDDCSPDDSIDILKQVLSRYPQRKKQVKLITHELNRGLSNARNTAFLNSTGTYIMHVDSDDYIDTKMVEIMLNEAVMKDADMAVCDFNSVFERHQERVNVNVCNDKFLYLSSLLLRRTTINMWGRIVKREIIEKNNILSISGLYHGEDYATTPRIVYYSNIILKVDKPLYYYVRSDEHLHTHFVNEKGISDLIRANQVLVDFFVSKGVGTMLPLEESKAMNKVNLFYSVPYSLYVRVAALYPELNLFLLDIPLHYKYILFISKIKALRILYLFIRLFR